MRQFVLIDPIAVYRPINSKPYYYAQSLSRLLDKPTRLMIGKRESPKTGTKVSVEIKGDQVEVRYSDKRYAFCLIGKNLGICAPLKAGIHDPRVRLIADKLNISARYVRKIMAYPWMSGSTAVKVREAIRQFDEFVLAN